ncbi:ectoine/hydroxyectoine ABC transporter ATP-binding protein EhuA [Sporosarcina sp. P37]|uniref:ectoine/hydroxyectoine ABC transporter ATP-binding protein EhuA n=1 Tax=unclassified Sporosarcina TaxID=2647733 RepID=UPI0009BEADF3|nr:MULTISPECIES: ectoine/hydroxyectoine ABC transporter ATP-binding protein EhuA [unclassified Sporosarcina]ARD47628.1 ectoine/hydroxyectoine ABC transporter ATP-binding protein EhuA [Sporosarcina sp. P33]ARK24149.1 ectoine/hydroxyectoine ABC transporter ATP-binding protein EhuA [Sporosarcina sp. P37]PID17432.1 ectoine/hydroxyectoine ABC transporter ATP-binding protein EhuA [Sporosarcina sp. P35]
MVEPIVQYKDVHKSFGKTEVLKGIDLDIRPSEKVALIGPSGSGKTTIIRMLMTLEEPTSGAIEVNGKNLWMMQKKGEWVTADEKHLRSIRGDIGMVFQHFNLFPHMTILENCMLAPVIVKNESKAKVKETAVEMLEKVGLGDKIGLFPAQLSGGQKQRVAMARALMMRPQVMLFDEVTSALDPELVGEVLEVIRDLAKEGEMAMILVTHEMDFALDIADRVVFLNEGVIEEEGPPSEILLNPHSERLQDFLGRFTNNR